MIRAKLYNGAEVNMRHIVIEGSSQWLIGRNVTTKCDIIHTNGNHLKLSNHTIITLQTIHIHSYVPPYIFMDRRNSNCSTFDANLLCATRVLKELTNDRPLSQLKKINDKVHKHVCGHAS